MDRLSGYLPEDYVPTRSNGQRDKSNEDAQSDYSSSSSSTSTYSSLSSSEDSEYLAAVEAEREWEENVRQLQLAVSVLILPTIGKWLGRKWSYWRACDCNEYWDALAFSADRLALQSTRDTSRSAGSGPSSCPRAGETSKPFDTVR